MDAYYNTSRNDFDFLIALTKTDYKNVGSKVIKTKTKEREPGQNLSRPLSLSVVKNKKPLQVLMEPFNKSWKNVKIMINEEEYKKLGKMKKPIIILKDKPFAVQVFIA